MDIEGDLSMITGLTIIGGIVIANVVVMAVGLMF
jgi:hypothetical protein